MAEGPFVFVGTYRVKEGRLADYKEHLSELVDLVEAKEPRLISFNVYLDEDGAKTTLVQVHPDAASMKFHMKVVAEHIASAGDDLEEESAIVCGADPEGVVDTIRQWSEGPLAVMPIHAVGFTRTDVR